MFSISSIFLRYFVYRSSISLSPRSCDINQYQDILWGLQSIGSILAAMYCSDHIFSMCIYKISPRLFLVLSNASRASKNLTCFDYFLMITIQ